MENSVLLKALEDAQLIDADVSKKLLDEVQFSRTNVEDFLYDRRTIKEEALSRVKSGLLKVPYKKVKIEDIPSDILGSIPEETIRNFRVVPLEKSKDLLVVGMVEPDNLKAQEALRFVAKKLRVNLGIYLVDRSLWESALRRYSSYQGEVATVLQSLNLSGKKGMLSSSQKIVELEAGSAVSEEAPIIRIVASTLKEAVYAKASDIHIEPLRNRSRIRFRIDGELQEASSIPIEIHQLIVSRVKVLSELKLDETRVPQDGRFRTQILGRDIDFRVATFPTAVGEKVAIRVLDPTIGLKGLPQLGLAPRNISLLTQALAKPYGMILMTGPTGSGKTTTLYALLQILNKDGVNIVSLEDPVEYFIEGLNQSQVRPEIGYDFASGLRQILRQDPDVIMIGEIRDTETAGLAVHAALTGHIVLSTLHTNNAVGVIPRLIDMKVDSFLLPPAVNIMAAQRLVPRLCDACRKPEHPSKDVAAIIEKELAKIPAEFRAKFEGEKMIYRAAGCAVCRGKGIMGRIAFFEVFRMTPELEDIITSGPTEHKILEEVRRQGMITLRGDGILKALEGVVAIEEVLRETTEV
ncbi:type II/IV secretion system protein [Candidatus Wolfebacteria bacterium]|nr:type II/IV secretion system protein [Candidatus Wolfebacteria bacterium]